MHQQTNPDSYAANIAAWRSALSSAASHGVIPSSLSSAAPDLLTIHTNEELSRALQTPQFGRPLALGAVVADAVAKREWIPTAEFRSAKGSIYKQGWGLSPWRILSWGLKQLGIVGEDGAGHKVAMGEFVIMANLEVGFSCQLITLTIPTCSI